MAPRIQALVNPSLLIWARDKAGLSMADVSAKLKISIDKISSWEHGTSKPTIRQARLLTHLYRRPLALFYLSSIPVDFKPMLHDYRRFPGQEAAIGTSNLQYEIRRALEKRNIALDLLELAGLEVPQVSLETPKNADPEAFAATLRSQIAVSFDEQRQWHSSYKALNIWREAIGNRGILIFQSSHVDILEMRGASINETPLPLILLNSSDSPNGRTFTIIHELVHILLNQSGICDLREDSSRFPEDREIEIYCNRVAGALLIPANSILNEEIVQNNDGPLWTEENILTLARKYSVSREVVLRRLLILGKTTASFYSQKAEEYHKEYLKHKAEGGGFALPHVIALSRSGSFFTSLVLESYYKERITSGDVSEYLDIKLKHITKIEESLSTRQKIGA